MDRALGNLEQLVWRSEYLHNGGCVTCISFEGKITKTGLTDSLLALKKLRPLLRANIDNNRYYFDQNESVHLPNIEFFFIGNESLSVHIQLILANTINYQDNSLYKLILLETSSNMQHLILAFHHVIADGNAGIYLLLDLLAMIELQQGASNEYKIIEHPIRAPLEESLNIPPALISNKIKHFNPFFYSHMEKKLKTIVNHHTFTEKTTRSLINFAKINTLTVNQLICTIVCISMNKELTLLNQNRDRIICMVPVNMRPYLPFSYNIAEMGYLSSRIDMIYNFEKSDTLLSVAKKLQKQFNEELEAKSYIDTLWNIKDVLEALDSNDDLLNSMKPMPSILVSNLGVIIPSYDFKYFNINKLHCSVACHGLFSHPFSLGLLISTYNNKMTINFHYLNNELSSLHMPSAINKIVNSLNEL
jgi:NRPS condensation-like uncharacterized protein